MDLSDFVRVSTEQVTNLCEHKGQHVILWTIILDALNVFWFFTFSNSVAIESFGQYHKKYMLLIVRNKLNIYSW